MGKYINPNYFKNDEEAECFDNRILMEMGPGGLRVYEDRLARFYANEIKRNLPNRDRQFISTLAVNCLAESLAREGGGTYRINVLPYNALLQAWTEQKFRLKKIGVISPKEYFGLIDEEARQIGVYIPKSSRQIHIETEISKAMKRLEFYLESRGIKSSYYIQQLLEEYLWRQAFPFKIGKIVICLTKDPLKDEDLSEIPLKYTGKLQMKFAVAKDGDGGESRLYYHIVRSD